MSKHSSQLSSPHHLSTHRLLPDVSLVPEEVCLHGTLSWNRPRLTSACMAIPHYSTRHTNERHTQETIVYQAAEIIRYLESRLREERDMPSESIIRTVWDIQSNES